jgi:hypothetical protein
MRNFPLVEVILGLVIIGLFVALAISFSESFKDFEKGRQAELENDGMLVDGKYIVPELRNYRVGDWLAAHPDIRIIELRSNDSTTTIIYEKLE